jgi:hypothetical protein
MLLPTVWIYSVTCGSCIVVDPELILPDLAFQQDPHPVLFV